MLGILNYFSRNISQILKKFFEGQPIQNLKTLEEIRIRSNGALALKFINNQIILEEKIRYEDIIQTLQIMCDNSIYSYQNEICNGYITIRGGHRVGISGKCVIEAGKVINISYISGINFRIARQVIGCSNNAIQYILRKRENTIYNTLIVSPPGLRKNNIIKRFNKKHKHRDRNFKFSRFKCRSC